jgi:ATP-binding cassette subfamily B protein
MFGFLRPVKLPCAVACVWLIVWIGAEILAVRQTAEAVNAIEATREARAEPIGGVAATDPLDPVTRAVLLLGGLSLALAVLSYLREMANTKLTMYMVFHIREAVYDQLQRVGLSFHDVISTGELINRAMSDLQNVRGFVNTAVLVTLEIVVIVGGYIALLLTRSPWVAALALAPLPIWVWYIIRFSRLMQPVQEVMMAAGDKNVSIITENIAGVHVVKAFATEGFEIARYGASCDDFFGKVMKRIRMYANFTPTMRAISMVSHLSLFLVAGILIIKGQLRPGDILMLGAAMGAILGRLQQVSVINEQYQNAIVSAKRLREVLDAAPRVPERPEARPLPSGPGAVRFERVTFGYDGRHPVLHDVSFEVPGGRIVALVGPTGAGKTTLVQLLARLYDPQRGRILVDGWDIRDATVASVRSQVALVFQETYLFSDTIEANIAYGDPRIHARDIETAARLAQAHEFVDPLPRGYQTTIGERGATLSGGQRQRLAIARALAANPRIMILDDATASVDPETEELIHRAMREALRGRTIFVIAHRINTVKRADLVIVLEHGRVTQTGTHDELMRADGHYRAIAEVQLQGEEESAATPAPAEVAP